MCHDFVTLNEGTILIYQSIGCILIALFSATAGYATLGTGMLPKWTGWVAYVAAGLNLVAVPLGLSIAPAAVLAVAIIADFPLQIWLLIVSSAMIRTREAATRTGGDDSEVSRPAMARRSSFAL
jgi:hypothetical protein